MKKMSLGTASCQLRLSATCGAGRSVVSSEDAQVCLYYLRVEMISSEHGSTVQRAGESAGANISDSIGQAEHPQEGGHEDVELLSLFLAAVSSEDNPLFD